MILFGLLLTLKPVEFPPMPFARGPIATSAQMATAIKKCRAPARLEEAGDAVLVFFEDGRTDRGYRCLSKWIYRNPQSGFEKFGFVGSEQQAR